jgi:hypothetical protein
LLHEADSRRLRRIARVGAARRTPLHRREGLARLVLGLIELLRRLLEEQAPRRSDAGRPTDDGIERIGDTVMSLVRKVEELKSIVGRRDGDPNLDPWSTGRSSKSVARGHVLEHRQRRWYGDPDRWSTHER